MRALKRQTPNSNLLSTRLVSRLVFRLVVVVVVVVVAAAAAHRQTLAMAGAADQAVCLRKQRDNYFAYSDIFELQKRMLFSYWLICRRIFSKARLARRKKRLQLQPKLRKDLWRM